MHYRNSTRKDQLGTRVEGRFLEREMAVLRVKARMERERMVKDALEVVPNLEFWCSACRKDFVGYGYKQTRKLPGNTLIAFWYGHCPKLHRSMRRITDKHNDPYYRESELVLRQALQFSDDLMGPDDPRFALRYPQAYERWQTDNGEYQPPKLELG